MKKKILVAALAAATMMTLSMSLYADSTGWRKNATGWWYATNDAGTTWHANSWQWLDGNKDGIAECYYFDGNGYCLMNTTTPDGYQVDANGAWIVNGVVQTKQVGATSDSTSTGSGNGVSTTETDTGIAFADYNWKYTPDEVEKTCHAGTTVSKYLGVYVCTSATEGAGWKADGSDYLEAAILSDGSMHNHNNYGHSSLDGYSEGPVRVNDTKWSDHKGNCDRVMEILDNGNKLRYTMVIGSKVENEIIWTKVSD